eukprot:TRINITY_DN10693_c0_g1_i1.p1 TRINITY_DN10693_c0_g1~~TRINITY_DN10693_c0_g1_i1.p1  ORF type:complete len:111 (-),score=9.56 TRINITY_DN10693_c0_g1_i1:334-666(-)
MNALLSSLWLVVVALHFTNNIIGLNGAGFLFPGGVARCYTLPTSDFAPGSALQIQGQWKTGELHWDILLGTANMTKVMYTVSWRNFPGYNMVVQNSRLGQWYIFFLFIIL